MKIVKLSRNYNSDSLNEMSGDMRGREMMSKENREGKKQGIKELELGVARETAAALGTLCE